MLDKAPSAWSGMTPGRQLSLVLAVAAPVTLASAVAGFWPLFFTDVALALVNTVLFIALIVIGLVLLTEPGQARPGLAMISSGLLLIVSWSNEWKVSPLPFLSNVVGLLWLLAGGWALYRYPDQRLDAADRRVFRIMLFWFVLTPWLSVLVSRAEWHSFPKDTWWLTLWADRGLYSSISIVTNFGTLVFAALYVYRWTVRLRRARPAERRLKTPTSAAAIFAGCLASVIPVGGIFRASDSTSNVLYLLSAIGCLTVPIAFLVSVLRRHLARANLAGLLPSLYAESSPLGVQAGLRRALEDPSLTLAIWSESDADYLDVDTGTAPALMLSGNQLTTQINSTAGIPLALIRVDAALKRDPTLLDAALVAAGLTLQNTTLLRTVQAQFSDLQAASTRVIKSTDEERQRLERLLHDGAQQHFLALGLMIGVAETSTADPSMLSTLSQMREQLEHALGELRQLARGLHPSVLRMGLAPAVRETLRRYPASVQVDLCGDPLPGATETTAYYVICEAVANSVKHAASSKIQVRGSLRDNTFQLEISDNGCGGADFGGGNGLVGMRDRVTALGGRMSMVSEPDQGTHLTLSIPCV